jgi:signal transduction histidine kinase/ligand-binding sensor domain-containing protein
MIAWPREGAAMPAFDATIKRLGILVTAALVALPLPACAQRLPIRLYSTSDGLVHNVVNRIVRDSRGFLWFCTRGGLSRFDGRDFVTWGVHDGLPTGEVNDLVETPDGNFWIATERGVVRFDPTKQRSMFTTYVPTDDARTARVSSLCRDPSGALWVATAGGLFRAAIGRADRVSFRSVDLNIPDVLQARAIGSILVDRFGALWAGADGKVFRRVPAGTLDVLGATDGIPHSSISRILEDGTGRIWLAPLLGGLLELTNDGVEARPRVIRQLTPRDGLPVGGTFDLLEEGPNALWVASAGALVRVIRDTRAPSGLRMEWIAEREGLRAHEVSALAKDVHGNLWAAVLPYGVAKLAPGGFTTFAQDDVHAVSMSLVTARNGELIAFSHSAGRISGARFDGRAFATIAGARPRVTASWAWNQMALQDETGAWWFGGNEGVIRYDPGVPLERLAAVAPAARYSSADGLAADAVIRIFEDRRGDVWIATVGQGVTPNGLSVWHRGAAQPFRHFTGRDGLPPLDRYYVSSFASDSAGDLWIGFSSDAGLVRYDGQRFVRFTTADGVPAGQVRNLIVDSKGHVWGSTTRGGLVRVDSPESPRPTFRAYTSNDGLSSDETLAVVEARSGDIYVATARGVDKLDVASGQFTHFSIDTGSPLGEAQGALSDSHGDLWFLYSDAIARLRPEAAPPVRAPEIFISRIAVDGRPRATSAVGERAIENLRLPTGATLRLDLVAPWFGASDDVLYQYRLRQDEPWSEPSRQRSITYASLATGSYTFMARAMTSEGSVGPSLATARFAVVAPVWRRSWFALLVLGTVAGLAYAISRRRVTRLLELANMRTRIATDLHDDIGANLTRIALLSEVARQRHRTAAADDDPLASIATLSRESVGAMADIVWAISPARDRLGDLVSKMREHADETLSALDVRLTFPVVDGPQDDRIDLDVRRNLFLIFKEAINNAARHSACTAVDVAFGRDDDSFTLTIHDNGRGFDPAAEPDGNGLINMRRRAARMGGTLDIATRPGAGATIHLVLPLAARRRFRLPF